MHDGSDILHWKEQKEKKRKDYTVWRQVNEKPSAILGCPGILRCHNL